MNDGYKRVILVAGAIVGVPIAAFLAYVIILYGVYLATLAVILATLGAIGMVCLLFAKVRWAFKGPHAIREKDVQPVRALVDRQGRVTMVPFAPWPPGAQTIHIHQDSHSRTEGLLPAPVEEEEAEPTLRPTPWSTIVRQIPYGELPLGIGTDGRLRTGPRDQLKTCLTLGKSGSGKTVSVAGRLTAAATAGSLLVVIDPHYHKPDSLSKKILPLAGAFWQQLPIAVDVDQILAHLSLVQAELDARKQSGNLSPELLVVIEEYASLYDDPDVQDPLVKLSKGLTREARGFGIYGEFLTQDMSGGLAGRIRRLAQSYVIGRSDYSDADAILHDTKLARQVMRLAPGAALVVDAYGERKLLQQPHITRADIEEAARRLPQVYNPAWELPPLSTIMKPQATGPSLSLQGKVLQMPQKQSTPEERERERIEAALDEHPDWSNARIWQHLGFRNNNKITLIKAIREEREAAQEVDA